MFSVAVKGYGIVIWDGDGQWRTFGATDSMSATLSARVETALEAVLEAGECSEDASMPRSALSMLSGARLFSSTATTGPDECDGGDRVP